MDKRFFVAVSLSALVSSACGLISGVSDDYTYDGGKDSDSALVDGSVTTDSSIVPDSSSPDAGQVDAGADAGVCPGAIVKPDGVNERCQNCALATCCSAMKACNANPDEARKCADYLRCVEGCSSTAVGEPCRLKCRTDASMSMGTAVVQLAQCATQGAGSCVPAKCSK